MPCPPHFRRRLCANGTFAENERSPSPFASGYDMNGSSHAFAHVVGVPTISIAIKKCFHDARCGARGGNSTIVTY
jgi:hypothetical protein